MRPRIGNITPGVPSQDLLAARVDALRASIRLLKPGQVAVDAGVEYDEAEPGAGFFRFEFWGQPVDVSYPDIVAGDPATGKPVATYLQALIAYYLLTSDGSPLANNWVSFSELPDGRVYNQAFQGYSGDELARRYMNNLEELAVVAEKSGGIREQVADTAFLFRPLPRVPLLVTYWLGDDDFPASSMILFDESVPHYLPTDVCAILGGMLVRKLAKG